MTASTYIVHTARSQATGHNVTIFNLTATDAVEQPWEGHKWAVMCDEHITMVYAMTRREAHAAGREMDLYCEDCGADVEDF